MKLRPVFRQFGKFTIRSAYLHSPRYLGIDFLEPEPAGLVAGANMADGKVNRSGPNSSNKKEIYVKEELKIAVKLSLEKFRYDEEQKG